MKISKQTGGMLLIMGSCIGAGMLALPIVTGLAGFFPSLLSILVVWLFMMATALLLLEMDGRFPKQVNFLSMAEKTLGSNGKWLSWVLYLSLFYALLVSYVSMSGVLFSSFFPQLFSERVSSIGFTLLFGVLVYAGTASVDGMNRLLMAGLIFTYFGMIVSGFTKIEPTYLLHKEPSYMLLSLPVLVISFGFHNMVPTLTAYCNRDMKKMQRVIVGGSFLILFVYLVWMFLVMGAVPFSGILEIYTQKKEASIALSQALHRSWVATFAQGFAFFAIVTSFLAQALSLMHFLADGLKQKLHSRNRFYLTLLTLIPPLFFAFYYPHIFFQALNFSGGISAVLLFGVLPVCMVWRARYVKKLPSPYTLLGGKPVLLLIFAFALFILVQEILHIFS